MGCFGSFFWVGLLFLGVFEREERMREKEEKGGGIIFEARLIFNLKPAFIISIFFKKGCAYFKNAALLSEGLHFSSKAQPFTSRAALVEKAQPFLPALPFFPLVNLPPRRQTIAPPRRLPPPPPHRRTFASFFFCFGLITFLPPQVFI